MKIEIKEIFKLKVMLDNAEIEHEFYDRTDKLGFKDYIKYQIIVYNPITEDRLISVIEGYGTYGYEKDLLEIMGCLSKKEEKHDSVLGYLTAEEVFKRIKRHLNKLNKE